MGGLALPDNGDEYCEVSQDALTLLRSLSEARSTLSNNTQAEIIECLADLRLLEKISKPCGRKYLSKQDMEVLKSDKLLRSEIAPPLVIEWYPSGRCNLNCNFCFIRGRIGQETQTTTEQAVAFFDNISGCGIMKVSFLGGEPLLLPNIVDIIKVALKYPYQLNISTNGTVLPEGFVDLLNSKRINLTFSIQSYLEKEHDHIVMRSGAFEMLSRNVRILRSCGHYFYVSISIG